MNRDQVLRLGLRGRAPLNFDVRGWALCVRARFVICIVVPELPAAFDTEYGINQLQDED